MTELMEALRAFLVDEGYWAVVVSVVSVGGGTYILNKARGFMALIIGQLPSLVKDVMLKSLNVSEETASKWHLEIQEARAARKLMLEKELADIELKIGSPLLTAEQKVAYEKLKEQFAIEIANLSQFVTDKAVDAIENASK